MQQYLFVFLLKKKKCACDRDRDSKGKKIYQNSIKKQKEGDGMGST